MNVGTDELSRAAAAYAACLVFVVAFLVARPLLRPLLSTIVAAMVRDQAAKAKKPPEGAE